MRRGAIARDPGAHLERVINSAVVRRFGAVDRDLLGRAEDLAEVVALLDRGLRVVTITGRGGVGKTAVAAAVARHLEAEEPGRVTVVALDQLADPALVPSAIADALGLPQVDVDLVAAIAQHVGDATTTLLLDNFEHLLPAATIIADLVSATTGLSVLVTSQAPLHLRAEHVIALDPLELPEAGECDPDVLQEVGSVALYCARARAVDRAFCLDGDNASDVAELCRRLEGLPLAIELAAARALTLPPAAMVARLPTAPLDLLRRPLGDLPDRQRSLRQSITWTMDLLAPGERALLQRLSVITGDFDIDAAERLDDPARAVDHLAALVDHHLVEPCPGPGGAWFRLPPAIRTLAREELEVTGRADETLARHTRATAGWARDACDGTVAPGQIVALGTLAARQTDLVACLGDALARQEPEPALDLANALAMHWSATGYRRAPRGAPRGDVGPRRPHRARHHALPTPRPWPGACCSPSRATWA
jgi:predicted ATPase